MAGQFANIPLLVVQTPSFQGTAFESCPTVTMDYALHQLDLMMVKLPYLKSIRILRSACSALQRIQG